MRTYSPSNFRYTPTTISRCTVVTGDLGCLLNSSDNIYGQNIDKAPFLQKINKPEWSTSVTTGSDKNNGGLSRIRTGDLRRVKATS